MPILLLIFLLLVEGVLARESVPDFEPVAEGVEYRQVLLEKPRPITVMQLRCEPAKVRFQIIKASDGGNSPTATAREMVIRHHLLAAVNSSYFGTSNEILGYAERHGEVLNGGVASGGLFSAFFFWDGVKAGLRRRGESLDDLSRKIPVLFQCGPRLVWDSRPVEGLHSGHKAARSCLALDKEGRVVLVALGGLSRVSLSELPSILSAPVERGGVGALRAINLDGGKSTQLFLLKKGKPAYLPGRVRVPIFLGLSEK